MGNYEYLIRYLLHPYKVKKTVFSFNCYIVHVLYHMKVAETMSALIPSATPHI